MKQNMKRMLLVLCMAVCFFALSACGSASEEAVGADFSGDRADHERWR